MVCRSARGHVYSPVGPTGWTIDRSGVPGYGTAEDGVTEFAGWNFVDPLWWLKVEDQGRGAFSANFPDNRVIAVADSDEWDDKPQSGRRDGDISFHATHRRIKRGANAGVSHKLAAGAVTGGHDQRFVRRWCPGGDHALGIRHGERFLRGRHLQPADLCLGRFHRAGRRRECCADIRLCGRQQLVVGS